MSCFEECKEWKSETAEATHDEASRNEHETVHGRRHLGGPWLPGSYLHRPQQPPTPGDHDHQARLCSLQEMWEARGLWT